MVKTDYYDEMLERAVMNIKARRGRFYPDKNFGSFIGDIEREPYVEYALAYARQALENLDGVYAVSARRENGNTVLKLLINRREYEVELNDV